MVSKRQKLARKRFTEANPKPEPPKEAAGPTSERRKEEKKKKLKALKQKIEKKKNNSNADTISTKNSKNSINGFKNRSKHPLRIAGMRPGESCYICKSGDHIAKLCPEKSLWEKNKICLLCRQRGHSLKNCPRKSDDADKKFCYNCGESGHALSKCPLPLQDGGTKFANCFICNERGHLSKNCPKSSHGIYPKGGCCKICGGVTHLARDCPNKGGRSAVSSTGESESGSFRGSGQGKRTVFHSGDDLEDDFMVEDVKNSTKEKLTHSHPGSATAEGEVGKNVNVKPKKKQGPKVVNFLG